MLVHSNFLSLDYAATIYMACAQLSKSTCQRPGPAEAVSMLITSDGELRYTSSSCGLTHNFTSRSSSLSASPNTFMCIRLV